MENRSVTADQFRLKKGTRATGAVRAANDSRPVWSVFAVVIGELKESADQQLFNSIHRPYAAGFANIFPGIRFDAGSFVTTMGAVTAVVLRHLCIRLLRNSNHLCLFHGIHLRAIEPTASVANVLIDGPVGGPQLGQRGKVRVEPFAQRKQQTPQASDLDAALN